MNQFKLIISAVFKDNASSRLRNLSREAQQTTKSVDKMAGSFKNLAGAFTAMMVAGYLKRGLGFLVKSSQEMEMSMARLAALTQKAQHETVQLEQAAIRAAEVTIYGPTEAAAALTKLTQATGSAQVAMKTLTPTLDLAMASFGKLNPERTSRMVADMAKSFGMSGNELTASIDKTYAVTRALGLEIQTFEKIMGRMGQAAIIGGQSFDEMLIAMSMAARAAPSTLRASNQLLRTMSDLTTKGAGGMEMLGIKTRDAVTGKIEPMSKIMIKLAQRWAENQENVRDVLNATFGKGAVKPMLTAIAAMSKGIRTHNGDVLQGAEAYNYLLGTAKDSSGSAREAAEKMMNTGEGMMMLMNQAGENLARTIGDQVAPMLKWVYKGVKAIADTIRTMLDIPVIGWFLRWGAKLSFVAAVVGVVATALWGMVKIVQITIRNVWGETAAVDRLSAAYGRLSMSRKLAYSGAMAQPMRAQMQHTPGMDKYGKRLTRSGATLMPTDYSGAMHQPTRAQFRPQFQPTRAQMMGRMGRITNRLRGAVAGAGRAIGGAAATLGGGLMAMLGPVGLATAGFIALAAAIPHVVKALKKLIKDPAKERKWRAGLKGVVAGAKGIPGVGQLAEGMEIVYNKYRDIWKKEMEQEAKLLAMKEQQARRAKQEYDWMLLGSQRLEGLLGKLKGIDKQEFQVADVNALNRMLGLIAGAKNRSGASYGLRFSKLQQASLGMTPRMFELMKKGATTGMLPKEHLELAARATYIRQVVSELHRMGALTMGKKDLKNFTKKFVDPIRVAAGGEYARAETFKRSMTEEGMQRAHFDVMSSDEKTRETLRDGFRAVVAALEGITLMGDKTPFLPEDAAKQPWGPGEAPFGSTDVLAATLTEQAKGEW